MGVALNFLFKFLSWLGTILIMRKGAKDDLRADTAEKAIETITDANRPVADNELERVRDKYRRD